MRACAGLLTALTLLLGAAAPAGAGEATDRVRSFFADVNRIIADPSYDTHLEDRLAAMRRLVTDMVDFRSAAVIALGSEWTARSAAEREDFVRVFTALLETSVFASVGARARLDNGMSVTYLAEVADGENATVATTVLTRSDRELSVDYRMTRRQGRWVVSDVRLDGVSLVDNYRAQFQKVLQRSSYAELVAEMHARTADLGRPIAPAAVANAPAPVIAAPPISAAPPGAPARTDPSEAMALSTAEHRSGTSAWDAPRSSEVAPVPPVAVFGLAVARPREASPAGRAPVASAPEPAAPEPVRVTAVADPVRARPRAAQFWVQVGAFRSEAKAVQVATALRDQTVSLFTGPHDPLLRIFVGPFADRDTAVTKLREIRARGYDAFIPPTP